MEPVEAVERDLRRTLLMWSTASAIVGAVVYVEGRRRGDAVVRAFGTQTLLWAAVDASIAGASALSDSTPSATSLRRLLLVNAAADVGYIAVGTYLSARATRAPRWLRWPDRSGVHLRGHGLAVAVQGTFLLALDLTFANRLR